MTCVYSGVNRTSAVNACSWPTCWWHPCSTVPNCPCCWRVSKKTRRTSRRSNSSRSRSTRRRSRCVSWKSRWLFFTRVFFTRRFDLVERAEAIHVKWSWAQLPWSQLPCPQSLRRQSPCLPSFWPVRSSNASQTRVVYPSLCYEMRAFSGRTIWSWQFKVSLLRANSYLSCSALTVNDVL